VDIRGPSGLARSHNRPVLAKIYCVYISELVAVLKGNPTANEIYIEGDGLGAVFNTSFKTEVDSVLETAARIHSMIHILNVKLKRKGYSEIQIGIGLGYGESLNIKAGYKGSGINEVVWTGKVVGGDALLCKNGNRTYTDGTVLVSSLFRDNLAT
jgi:class 3 adenylate cyclase